MSSIMRWRNGLMGLSVMAITPVSHEVSEPHDLETGRAILFIPTSNPPRARSRWGVYRESGLVLGSIRDVPHCSIQTVGALQFTSARHQPRPSAHRFGRTADRRLFPRRKPTYGF